MNEDQMHVIRVQAVKPDQPGLVTVEWRLNDNPTKGIVNVAISGPADKALAIAELCALRHIIVERRIFGCDWIPNGGKAIVSVGAIRKFWKTQEADDDLAPYGRYVFFALDGCSLEVAKDRAFAQLPIREIVEDDDEAKRLDVVNITADYAQWPKVDFPILGTTVAITRHALQRYQERFSTPFVRRAMNGVTKILASDQLTELDRADRQRLFALLRHQAEARVFYYAPSKTHLVIAESQGTLILTTVYRDSDFGKELVYNRGRIETRYRVRAQ